MEEKLDQAILVVVAMIRPTVKADEALKFTQAALNLAHVKAQLEALTRGSKTKGAGG